MIELPSSCTTYVGFAFVLEDQALVKESILSCISDVSGDYSKQSFSSIVYDALTSLCSKLGVNTFIFAYSYQESLLAPEHHTITNAPEWMEHYAKLNLRGNDPVVQYLVENNSPVLWNDLKNRGDYAKEEHLEVLREASDFGLCYGVSVPCRASDCLGVLSFANTDEGAKEHYDDLMLYGSVLSNHLMDQMRQAHKVQPEAETTGADLLTQREIDCLFWASEGKTAWEIGQILEISERTVVFHLTNVVNKLDSSSRQHAISKAILLGILKPRF